MFVSDSPPTSIPWHNSINQQLPSLMYSCLSYRHPMVTAKKHIQNPNLHIVNQHQQCLPKGMRLAGARNTPVHKRKHSNVSTKLEREGDIVTCSLMSTELWLGWLDWNTLFLNWTHKLKPRRLSRQIWHSGSQEVVAGRIRTSHQQSQNHQVYS